MLPRLVQEAVDHTLTLVEAEPKTVGKQLRGRLQGLWSSRVGSYRILYTIEGSKARRRVIGRAIKHRGIAIGGRHRQSRAPHRASIRSTGGDDRIRTGDPLLAKQVLYH